MLAVLPFISQRSRFRNCLWSRSDQYAMIGCYAIYINSKKTMTNVSSMVKGIFRSLSNIYKWAFYKNSFDILAKSSISDVAHCSEYLYDESDSKWYLQPYVSTSWLWREIEDPLYFGFWSLEYLNSELMHFSLSLVNFDVVCT